jgi:hypothetical protein
MHKEGHDGIVQVRQVMRRAFVEEDGDFLRGAFGQHAGSFPATPFVT